MTVLRVNTLSGIGTGGPVFDGELEFNSQNYVILPKGTTSDRVGVGSTPGALRYNTDSNKVELYDGSQWTEVQASIPLSGGPRGLFGGGYSSPATLNTIDFITISSTGNAVDFGDLTTQRSNLSSLASPTRGVFAGGYSSNVIDYVTISSTGNALDFGDLSQIRGGIPSACSSSTRGIIFGGYGASPPSTDTNSIDYITISSTGNAQDFGDMLSSAYGSLASACSSTTRGVVGGSYAPANTNVIQYVTIASTGNSVDFGDMTEIRRNLSACSSPTRGLFMGGINFPATVYTNTIDFITISTLGNASDFGDLLNTTLNASACSSQIRGIYAGGNTPTPAVLNVIQFVTMTTLGNAIDFGDLTQTKNTLAACTNAHGGL